MRRIPSLLLSTLLSACALASTTALAQGSRDITKIIVPYPAGGPLDTTARLLAEAAGQELGTIIVENKPGAGGNIGLAQVAHAPKDGHTLGIAAVATMAINPAIYASMPYDADKDFAGITLVARVPNVLVMNTEVANALNVHSVEDLIAYAKAHPDALNYGSAGNGSAGHIAGEMLKKQAGIDVLHVPYNGANPAQFALINKEVHFNFDNLATASANIKAGKLTALAVTSDHESPLLPGVAPLSRILPDFAIDTWWSLVVPAGTPAQTIEHLNKAFVTALNTPEIQQHFTLLLAEPAPTGAAELDDFMRAQRAHYAPLVKATGARID